VSEFEDIWLRTPRFTNQNNDDAKVILANAVRHVGQSVKIWIGLEPIINPRSVPSGKASLSGIFFATLLTDVNPPSPRACTQLWKETVNLEESKTDARILLARAVEVIPLATTGSRSPASRLPNKKKRVLNMARKVVLASHEIWPTHGARGDAAAQDTAGAPK
jgi:pre-mRNA-processing factor 6